MILQFIKGHYCTSTKVAPRDVKSGEVVIFGKHPCVFTHDTASGEQGTVATHGGEWEGDRGSVAVTDGNPVSVDANGDIASSGEKLGIATSVVGTTVRVLLAPTAE
ncbi:MAG: DUF2190 family protein [Planctomycetota bacterium]